jgi:hypothetical protein
VDESRDIEALVKTRSEELGIKGMPTATSHRTIADVVDDAKDALDLSQLHIC